MSSGAAHIAARKARLIDLDDAALTGHMLAAAIEVAMAERASCAVRINQLSREELNKVLKTYPQDEAWRWCATDALQRLVDGIAALERRADARIAATGASPQGSTGHAPHAVEAQPELPLGSRSGPPQGGGA